MGRHPFPVAPLPSRRSSPCRGGFGCVELGGCQAGRRRAGSAPTPWGSRSGRPRSAAGVGGVVLGGLWDTPTRRQPPRLRGQPGPGWCSAPRHEGAFRVGARRDWQHQALPAPTRCRAHPCGARAGGEQGGAESGVGVRGLPPATLSRRGEAIAAPARGPCSAGGRCGCCRGMGKLRQGWRGLHTAGMGRGCVWLLPPPRQSPGGGCTRGRRGGGAGGRIPALGVPPRCRCPCPPRHGCGMLDVGHRPCSSGGAAGGSSLCPRLRCPAFGGSSSPAGAVPRHSGARGASAPAWHRSVAGLTGWGPRGSWGFARHGPSHGDRSSGLERGPTTASLGRAGTAPWAPIRPGTHSGPGVEGCSRAGQGSGARPKVATLALPDGHHHQYRPLGSPSCYVPKTTPSQGQCCLSRPKEPDCRHRPHRHHVPRARLPG